GTVHPDLLARGRGGAARGGVDAANRIPGSRTRATQLASGGRPASLHAGARGAVPADLSSGCVAFAISARSVADGHRDTGRGCRVAGGVARRRRERVAPVRLAV